MTNEEREVKIREAMRAAVAKGIVISSRPSAYSGACQCALECIHPLYSGPVVEETLDVGATWIWSFVAGFDGDLPDSYVDLNIGSDPEAFAIGAKLRAEVLAGKWAA